MSIAFNSVANDYDTVFSDSPIGKAQRNRVWNYLRQLNLKPDAKILETNAGTGVDAVWFAEQGFHITATDVAEGMLEIASTKLSATGKSNFQTFIWDLNTPFPITTTGYDIIFSNFGGWNCLDKKAISLLSNQLNALLKPDGKIVAVVMGRKCIWEKWYFRIKGNYTGFKRRNSINAVSSKLDDGTFIDTWYYSPNELAEAFPQFEITNLQPIGLFIPPSYLNPFFSKKQFLLKLLVGLEKCFPFRFLSDYADHYIITLQKK